MIAKAAFCTLFEGDYHHGVAALAHSLASAGFEGKLWAGYRGSRPEWAAHEVVRAEKLEVHFVRLETEAMLANYKPQFMLDVLQIHDPLAEVVAYLDPDIVWSCEAEFLGVWVADGVALCRDGVFQMMPATDFFRHSWKVAASRIGLEIAADFDPQYFNSGFVAAHRRRMGFLELWKLVLDSLPEFGIEQHEFKPHTRHHPFHGTDQDALNVACMANPEAIRSLGPEAMGFQYGLEIMWHATENPKPWRRFFLMDLIRLGRPVPRAHREYWRHVRGPLCSWPKWKLPLKMLDLRTAVVLSRFYHSA